MAQNITLMGADYSAVPAVTLPKTGGGTASFTDVTDTTATASNVAAGSYFYTAAGVRTEGSATVYNGAHHSVSSGYTVTVSLTNPINPGQFGFCKVYEADAVGDTSNVTLLYTFSSATGSAEVTTNKSVIYILFDGVSFYPGTLTCSSGIVVSLDYSYEAWFTLSGNGTINYDGNDYDD